MHGTEAKKKTQAKYRASDKGKRAKEAAAAAEAAAAKHKERGSALSNALAGKTDEATALVSALHMWPTVGSVP